MPHPNRGPIQPAEARQETTGDDIPSVADTRQTTGYQPNDQDRAATGRESLPEVPQGAQAGQAPEQDPPPDPGRRSLLLYLLMLLMFP